MTPIRVVLIDDHPLLRAGVRAQLEGLPGVTVVGEASNAGDGIDRVEAARPDIVLMDISMPGIPSLAGLRMMTERFPATRVVMLTMHDQEEYVLSAMRGGAAGYLLKDAKPAELQLALETVAAGNTFISPAVAKTLAAYLQKTGTETTRAASLTPRQREVLRLIAESRHTKEIAAMLGISIKTVEMHRVRIMEKLAIHDVPGLVRYAVRAGIIRTDH
jgi:DNA-binding NarL/FixJ family response regulator